MAPRAARTSDPRVRVTPRGVLREEGAGRRQQAASPSARPPGVPRPVTIAPEAAVTLKNSPILSSSQQQRWRMTQQNLSRSGRGGGAAEATGIRRVRGGGAVPACAAAPG